jgi:quercetin dioxygenase-like cupin family protein
MAPAMTGIMCAVVGVVAAQQTPQLPPGFTRTEIVNNATVLVARIKMAPGAREEVHTHPFSAVVVQIGAADVDIRLGDKHSTSRREHGVVDYIPKELPHAAANAGRDPLDFVTIAVKADRRPGGEAPPTPAPEGITRTPVLDNTDARVTRVSFAPSAREPVHTHPFDLVVVQLTPGRVEVRLGSDVTTKDYAAGDVIFLPRDVPHAVSNVGTSSFDVLSVGIK